MCIDACGHGAVLVAKELNRLGVNAFCVASVFEGIELRQNGVLGKILILGYTFPRYVPLLNQYQLTQTILDYSYALELNARGQNINVHIKIDTGMNRLGERCEHSEKLRKIFTCHHLHITGVYTHLYEDDFALPENQAAALAQGRAFYQTVEQLKMQGCPIPKVHVLASGGLLHCPDIGGDYARPGIALYGQMSTKEEWRKVRHELRPVLSVKARIALVKTYARAIVQGMVINSKRSETQK